MRRWWQDLTDLVLPAECGGCGRPRSVLCPECRDSLGGGAPRRVRPVPEPPGLPAVYAAARYADEVRAVLLAHKERGALALSGPLGAALAGAVRAGLSAGGGGGGGGGAAPVDRGPAGRPAGEAAGRPVLLVPVPSARRTVRARGHDPARRIALAAAAALRRGGTPARVLAVLRQRRAVADQSGLDSRRRLANLAGALTVAPGGVRLLSDGPVVLVDDLMTTGATLAEAARAVRTALRGTPPAAGPARTAGPGTAGAAAGAGGPGPLPDGSSTALVYRGESWEGREERRIGSTREKAGRWSDGPERAGDHDGADEVICAAVVAASPDSFEINRN
ncbi:ComF family protein [Streptomyces sp. NPDC085946]|uniref:ComF family protein n=1 Tax=Streptomyces sp. NPDC085946 TaxID=3365744 RepID=UPI0037D2DA79